MLSNVGIFTKFSTHLFDLIYWQLKHFNTLPNEFPLELNSHRKEKIFSNIQWTFHHEIHAWLTIIKYKIQNATFIDVLKTVQYLEKANVDKNLKKSNVLNITLNFKVVNFVNWLEIFGSIIHCASENWHYCGPWPIMYYMRLNT